MVTSDGWVLAMVSDAVAFRSTLRSVEVEVLSGEAAALVAEEMARVEKASAALRAMAAARAADCGAHRAAGYADPDEWMARMTGESRSKARSDLATGSRLSDCPRTKAAAADGSLSLGQAEEITKTEREKPGSEDELVDKAKTSSRQQLADECRKRRQDGVDPVELAAKQRSRRSFRSWVDGDGMQCALLKFEPIVGVALLARIQVEADRRHRDARREGSTEPWEAHAADAVAAILAAGLGWAAPVAEPAVEPAVENDDRGAARAENEADGEGAAPAGDTPPPESPGGAGGLVPAARPRAPRRADVVFVVDLRTYRRGIHADSLCHIIGGGPVPPDIVREMAKDAFLKVVFHDGVNIHTVTHVGRYRKVELETALELGGPPEFNGVTCSVCGNKFRLEWDHPKPICAGGVTSFENEDPKCRQCHAEKSRQEREAGLYRRRTTVESEPDPPPDTG